LFRLQTLFTETQVINNEMFFITNAIGRGE
jgi:hypothetical protein